MDHDAKLLLGTLSADVPVTCSLACWLFPTLYPLPSSAPCVSCIGSRKEGEAPVLPGSIAGWGQSARQVSCSWCASDGCIEVRVCRSWITHLCFLDLWHQRGQMPGILLPLERTKLLLAHHWVSGCWWVRLLIKGWEKWWSITIKSKGIMGEEGRTDGEVFTCKILLLAKGEHTSQELFSLIKILTCSPIYNTQLISSSTVTIHKYSQSKLSNEYRCY